MFIITRIIYHKINDKRSFPTDMFAYLVIHNSFVTAVEMKPIAYMKCQIFLFHLEQCFIQKLQEKNCQHLCYQLCASTSVEIYFLGKEKYPTFNVRSSWEEQHFYSQLLPWMISKIYVSSMVMYHPFIESYLSESIT